MRPRCGRERVVGAPLRPAATPLSTPQVAAALARLPLLRLVRRDRKVPPARPARVCDALPRRQGVLRLHARTGLPLPSLPRHKRRRGWRLRHASRRPLAPLRRPARPQGEHALDRRRARLAPRVGGLRRGGARLGRAQAVWRRRRRQAGRDAQSAQGVAGSGVGARRQRPARGHLLRRPAPRLLARGAGGQGGRLEREERPRRERRAGPGRAALHRDGAVGARSRTPLLLRRPAGSASPRPPAAHRWSPSARRGRRAATACSSAG